MRGRSGSLVLVYALLLFEISGCLSGDRGTLTTTRRPERSVPALRHGQGRGRDTGSPVPVDPSYARVAKLHPATLLASRFPQAPRGWGVGFLAQTHDHVQVENAPVSTRHLIIVTLKVDVRKLNMTSLRTFREGVAAALDVLPQQVHINSLNAKRNAVELYVSSDVAGATEPIPTKEVIHSLNVNTLHGRLAQFGVTEVTSEKNVLQGQHERDNVWTKEGFYAVVIFLTIFVIIVTCLMVLYRLKEKVELSDQHAKEPPGRDILLAPVRTPKFQAKATISMVQAGPPPKPASDCAAEPLCPAVPAPPPAASPSPFRMKPSAGLQERRGSNVSLVLDMSVLGVVEPLGGRVAVPRERATTEYLQSARRALSRQHLRLIALNAHSLHAEFAEIPMNFVDPKELDIPTHGAKNRYKTILPNPHSRVILKTKGTSDPPGGYINANYVRGYQAEERTYIATQGPMINTVNDFWQMAWQEDSPVIVMITKLKEKNEKCVLYWPEKRGIYGKVEVLVDSVKECDHYTVRRLTLQQGGQSKSVKHYWYTSWPDHKTPDSAQPLLQLMAEVEGDRRAAGPRGPIIVHCSAGIGRTGCFIATTIGCRQLREEGAVDVLGIVCQLRADRGGMIQTGEQYEFVHHALSLYESRLSTEAGQ